MVKQCVICRDAIWHTEGRLCLAHRGFAVLWSAVAAAVRTDWPEKLISHREMQLEPALGAAQSWRVVVADVLRIHGAWLDDYGDDHGIAA